MSQSKEAPTPAKFGPGDAVRVRSGTMDPQFPDIPIGGWAGKVTEVEQGNPPLYFLRWSRETLKNIHPIYKNRCERDGLDFESMWLGEDELEADSGGPVILDQPTSIVTPPLSMNDQDDRIRAVFGLTRDDLLPDVEEDSLREYYRHLAAKLKFPFAATWVREAGMRDVKEQVTVLGLANFAEGAWMDETYGIMCKAKMTNGQGDLPLAEMEKVKGKPNKQLLEDYSYWLTNHG
jgi:hypothetical protein